MKSIGLYPYKIGSQSAKLLADALNIRQIKHANSNFKGRDDKVIINWGAKKLPHEVLKCGEILNQTTSVGIASNKLTFFELMQSINHEVQPRVVPWATSKTFVEGWLSKNYLVVARKTLTGHSGYGIVIVEPGQEIPDAPLYTQYIKKDSEWRIHVFKGNIIFKQRKIKNPNIAEPVTWKIRSHQNGFIYQHQNLEVPADVEKQALLAFNASGLDFGGVDVIYNKSQNKAYVLEINTACGLEGTTVEVYANAFKSYIEGE